MIETFSIKEEKFINEVYNVNLGVSFNRNKIFDFLEKNNIFPSIPLKKQLLFIPVIIDEDRKELFIFSNNKIFQEWNNEIKNFHLIEYILPTEDLEDINIIKSKFEFIEEYDFKEIINKYNLSDSIVVIIFRNTNELRVLSKMNIQNNITIKNQSFSNFDIDNELHVKKIINELKKNYEDFWKRSNQINTSIKLSLNIMVSNEDNLKISDFEKNMTEIDLIYDFFIKKFDKNFSYYQIIFNGTPDIFIKTMEEFNYKFNTQNKVWILK